MESGELAAVAGMTEAARRIHRLGPGWVLVKGGHLEGVEPSPGTAPAERVPDVLFDGDAVTVLTGTWVDTPNTHGTGCSLSAAIAARLASGASVPRAVAEAKEYVHRALVGAAGWRLGAGHGPVDHLGWSSSPGNRGTAGGAGPAGPETTAAGSQ